MTDLVSWPPTKTNRQSHVCLSILSQKANFIWVEAMKKDWMDPAWVDSPGRGVIIKTAPGIILHDNSLFFFLIVQFILYFLWALVLRWGRARRLSQHQVNLSTVSCEGVPNHLPPVSTWLPLSDPYKYQIWVFNTVSDIAPQRGDIVRFPHPLVHE